MASSIGRVFDAGCKPTVSLHHSHLLHIPSYLCKINKLENSIVAYPIHFNPESVSLMCRLMILMDFSKRFGLIRCAPLFATILETRPSCASLRPISLPSYAPQLVKMYCRTSSFDFNGRLDLLGSAVPIII